MGLLEGSGRGGKGADGTQREVHQRHIVCQKVERDWVGGVRREVEEGKLRERGDRYAEGEGGGGERMREGKAEYDGEGRRGERCVRYQRER